MAVTATYTLVDICDGGCHIVFDVTIGANTTRIRIDVDELRAALPAAGTEEREKIITDVLRVHIAGRTRAQLVTEFGTKLSPNPVVITV